jgi:hypothetical protein
MESRPILESAYRDTLTLPEGSSDDRKVFYLINRIRAYADVKKASPSTRGLLERIIQDTVSKRGPSGRGLEYFKSNFIDDGVTSEEIGKRETTEAAKGVSSYSSIQGEAMQPYHERDKDMGKGFQSPTSIPKTGDTVPRDSPPNLQVTRKPNLSLNDEPSWESLGRLASDLSPEQIENVYAQVRALRVGSNPVELGAHSLTFYKLGEEAKLLDAQQLESVWTMAKRLHDRNGGGEQ